MISPKKYWSPIELNLPNLPVHAFELLIRCFAKFCRSWAAGPVLAPRLL